MDDPNRIHDGIKKHGRSLRRPKSLPEHKMAVPYNRGQDVSDILQVVFGHNLRQASSKAAKVSSFRIPAETTTFTAGFCANSLSNSAIRNGSVEAS